MEFWKGLVQLSQPMLQNLGEADQDRQRDAAQLELLHQLPQVDAARGSLVGMHPQVPVRAHGEIAFAPTGDIVEFAGVDGGPSFGRFPDSSFTQFQFAATSSCKDINLQCPSI